MKEGELARRPEDLGSSAQDVVLGIQNLAAGTNTWNREIFWST
jgi:hypothetical protein